MNNLKKLYGPRPAGWNNGDEYAYRLAQSDYRSLACMAGLLTAREREEKQEAYNMMRKKEAKLHRLCAREEL